MTIVWPGSSQQSTIHIRRCRVSFLSEMCSTIMCIILAVHKSPLHIFSSFVHFAHHRYEGDHQIHFTPHGAVSGFLRVDVLSSANQRAGQCEYFLDNRKLFTVRLCCRFVVVVFHITLVIAFAVIVVMVKSKVIPNNCCTHFSGTIVISLHLMEKNYVGLQLQ